MARETGACSGTRFLGVGDLCLSGMVRARCSDYVLRQRSIRRGAGCAVGFALIPRPITFRFVFVFYDSDKTVPYLHTASLSTTLTCMQMMPASAVIDSEDDEPAGSRGTGTLGGAGASSGLAAIDITTPLEENEIMPEVKPYVVSQAKPC